MRAFLHRLVDILSTLVRHLRKGYAEEYQPHSQSRTIYIETAFRYLGVSARHFHESLVFLYLAARNVGYYLRSLAISLYRTPDTGFQAVQQSQGQTSHSLKTHSCPPENTQREVLSNAENVDGNQPISDALKSCKKSRLGGITGEKISKPQKGDSI